MSMSQAGADGPDAFLEAVTRGDLERAGAMLDAGVDAATVRSREGDPPAVLAARRGRGEMLRLLIERGAAINGPGAGGLTVLHHVAVNERLLPMLGWLLGRGAALEARARFGATPLLHAVGAVCLPGVEALLARGADVHACDTRGNAALVLVRAYNAFRRDAGHGPELRLLRTLLDRGVDPNAPGWGGRTAVIEAAELGHDDALALLCEFGGRPDGVDASGLTALQAAALAGQAAAAATLRARRAKLDVFSAVSLGEIDTVREKLEADPAVANAVLASRRASVLSLAIAAGRRDMVKLLLDHGADPNGPTPWTSALHTAMRFLPDRSVIEWLIRRGATVDAADADGNTPLNLAARAGDVAIAALLIEHGADVNAPTERGYTPLTFAATEEMRALLRRHGGR